MSSTNKGKGKEPFIQQQQQEEEKLILKCNDGEEFVVELSLAKKSKMLEGQIEDGLSYYKEGVPLPLVSGPVMAKILQYWKREAEIAAAATAATTEKGKREAEREMQEYQKEFVKMERDEMFAMINANSYLHCQNILDLLCKAVADLVKDMSVEQVREYFNVKNDYTPEEEAEVRRQNAWAFQ